VLRLLPPTEHRRVRWKNGGGWTTELARAPAEGEFDWRISIAEIDVDGEFSRFEGIDRSLLVLAGEGMVLECAGVGAHTLRASDPPFAFAGELDVFARLLAGPTRDFNVMTRRGRFDHALTRVELAGTHALAPAYAGTSWLVYVEAGRAELGPHALAPGHAALLDEPLALRGHATLVVATLCRVGG
jgi:hypothetical protein